MKISGIYKIQSVIKPDRIYIGSAVNIGNRWGVHLCHLRKGKHSSIKLQRHFLKYGESDLRFSILLGCEKEDLIKNEQYFIDSYNPYFNICKIAGNSLGIKRSEETKLKLIKSHKGQIPWNKGKTLSKEHIEKNRKGHIGQIAWNKGKKLPKHSEEHKKKQSDGLRISWITRELKYPTNITREKMSSSAKNKWERIRNNNVS